MKKYFVFILFIGTQLHMFGQEKLLNIQDAILGTYGHLAPSYPGRYQWTTNKDYFSVIRNNTLNLHHIKDDGNHGNKTISLHKFNLALSKIQEDTFTYFPRIKWVKNLCFEFSNGSSKFLYNTKENICQKKIGIERDLINVKWASDNKGIAGTYQENLKISFDNKEGEFSKTILVQDAIDGTVFGQSVHRNEFGITNGIFWSPKGSKLAYYAMDETMVSDYPLYNLKDTPASYRQIKYPVAGAKSHHVELHIVDLASEKKIKLENRFSKDDYWTNISWGPNEEYIYVAHVNRAQNHMQLCKYEVKSGKYVKTLFEEKNNKYVEPEHSLTFLKQKPNQFLWWSEKDGYQHLYLYNTDGQEIQQLTKGNWVVTELVGIDEVNQKVFFIATKNSPIDRHLYSVSLDGGKVKKITQENGTHRVWANKNFSLFFDYYSNTETPAKLQIISGNSGKVMEVFHEADNPLSEYNLGTMSLGTINNDKGDLLHYRLIKPINFDPNKKYPVVVYLYNGPHVQLVKNNWLGGANLWYHYMAQNGYAVFTIDGRGSDNRGFDFESCIHRQLGTLEMKDQIAGINWLKNQNWVDSSRLGVHGWSYGGFMTASLLTRYPKLFKVGVAGGPVIDWKFYEIMYTERYMDKPNENKDGYNESNLMNYIDQLRGKLLMIHGGQDDVVLWQHSLNYLRKAIQRGVQLDYFVYPHHAHNVVGKERVHLYEKISNYFFTNL